MFYLGIDLGQRQDPSAVVLVERRGSCLVVRYVERVPLGTPYPRVVQGVREAVSRKEVAGRCAVAVDATGVGAPVVDLLRSAGLGCEISAVTITGGERERQAGSNWWVPKRDLIAEVQVRLERGS